MLNLAQISAQIKSADLSRAVRNPGHICNLNDAYRGLKDLGWTSALEMHPVDRVPVLRRGEASIRRNKDVAGAWIVEIGEAVFDASGDLAEITAEVDQVLAGPAEAVYTPGDHVDRLSPEQQIAAELKALHPELSSRIDRALALVEAGTIEFPHYQTGAILTTNPPTRRCSCPDAKFRAPQLASIGHTCKHCLAQLIYETARQQAATVAGRKFADKWEMARARGNGLSSASHEGWGGRPEQDPDQALPAWVDRRESIEDML